MFIGQINVVWRRGEAYLDRQTGIVTTKSSPTVLNNLIGYETQFVYKTQSPSGHCGHRSLVIVDHVILTKYLVTNYNILFKTGATVGRYFVVTRHV